MPRKKGTPKTGGRKPGSKNKNPSEIKLLAQEHGPEALAVLVKIMKSEEAEPSPRIAAAKEVLERAYGKSAQSVEVKNEDGEAFQFLVLGGGLSMDQI